MNGVFASYASGKNSSHGSNMPMDKGVYSYSNDSGSPEPTVNIITLPPEIASHTTPALVPPTEKPVTEDSPSHILAYVLVPLGSLVVIAALSFLVVFILKKSKLDKLRHHLMPLYNFDPAEEEGDWESELLEEDREQQVALQIRSPMHSNGPTLKFTTELLEV